YTHTQTHVTVHTHTHTHTHTHKRTHRQTLTTQQRTDRSLTALYPPVCVTEGKREQGREKREKRGEKKSEFELMNNSEDSLTLETPGAKWLNRNKMEQERKRRKRERDGRKERKVQMS